jgi:hypothetical protein
MQLKYDLRGCTIKIRVRHVMDVIALTGAAEHVLVRNECSLVCWLDCKIEMLSRVIGRHERAIGRSKLVKQCLRCVHCLRGKDCNSQCHNSTGERGN